MNVDLLVLWFCDLADICLGLRVLRYLGNVKLINAVQSGLCFSVAFIGIFYVL